MKRHIDRVKNLAFSATAKDTYILFIGNVLSAFLGFLYTLLIARALSVSDFGVFSAVNNLVIIIASVSDLGISAGLVSFVAGYDAKGDQKSAYKFLKASLIVRFLAVIFLAILIFLLSKFVAKNLLATDDATASIWAAVLSIGLLFWGFFPYALQAYKRFKDAVITDLSLGFVRFISVAAFFYIGIVSLNSAFSAFLLGTIASVVTGTYFIGTKYLKVKTNSSVYGKLLRFSGWLGVNRVISAISARLDVQMLAALAGATATGLYSISSRLAYFIPVLAGSFSSVLAPRFSSFHDKNKEKAYVLKATLALIPMVMGVIFWIIIAKPFIVLLFGEKYLAAVPFFQALGVSMIPFIISVPAVTAIIYSLKKPIYVGYFSIFQLGVIFLMNLFLIPKIGAFAPAIAFGITHLTLAIYSWVIVIRYYWSS